MKDKTLVKVRGGYMKAPTKNLLGYNKRLDKIPHSRISDIERTLAVRGTFDELAKTKFDRKIIEISHPLDSDFKKRIMGLNEKGKEKLARLKKKS